VHVDKEFSMLRRSAESSAGTNDIEIEANLFAAELLMPESFLTQEFGDESLDIENENSVNAIAKIFRVSPSAMRFRLGNLFG
jgi:Zn-dependent peptidase ImmA (M78 family)